MLPQRNIYELLDEWGGESFDPHVAMRWATMPRQQIRSLHDFYEEQRPDLDAALPDAPGRLRPLYYVRDDLRGPFVSDRHYLALPQHRRALSVLLLYAHTVVVQHRLRPTLWSAASSISHRKELASTLSIIAELRPLHDVGALYWVGWPGLERVHASNAYAAAGIDELLSQHRQDLAGLGLDPASLTSAIFELVEGSTLAEEAGADILFHTSDMASLYELALSQWAPRGGRAERSPHLQLLASVQLPSMNLPSFVQVAELRRHDEQFAVWRTTLGDSLQFVAQIGAGTASMSDLRYELSERLLPATLRLEREFKKSKSLASLHAGAASFGLSGVGAGITALLGEAFVPSVAGAAGSAIAGSLIECLRGRGTSRAGKALLAHHLTFRL